MPRPSPYLPADVIPELDAMRAQKRIDTCRIRSKGTPTRDRGGAPKDTWGDPGDPVSCRVIPANRAMQEGIRGGRVAPEADVEIRVHRNVTVKRDDKIVHAESGQTFDVLNDPNVATTGLELVISGKDANG